MADDWGKWLAYNVFWGVCPYCEEYMEVVRKIVVYFRRRAIFYRCKRCSRTFVKLNKYVVDEFGEYWGFENAFELVRLADFKFV